MRMVTVIIVALLAGFGGSALHTFWKGSQTLGVVSAHAYELRASDGTLVGQWGTEARGKHRSVTLLITNGGGPQFLVGVGPDNTPFVTLNGADGNLRFGVSIDHYGRSSLVLSDSESEGRIFLGFQPGDFPSPDDNVWGLSIRAPASERALASLTVGRHRENNKFGGGLFLRGPAHRVLLQPLEQPLTHYKMPD